MQSKGRWMVLIPLAFCAASAGLVFGAEGTPRLARPTPQQAAWQDLEVGMFIHFAPNTWQNQEYDDLSTPLAKINSEKLDTDQWVAVAKSMGARYIVFVAKHVVTMEEITEGQRVRQYVLEAQVDGAWREVARGTAVGHKKIDSFPAVQATAIRLRVT